MAHGAPVISPPTLCIALPRLSLSIPHRNSLIEEAFRRAMEAQQLVLAAQAHAELLLAQLLSGNSP
jgi:hypothetical protein